jgi:hypothetical protein
MTLIENIKYFWYYHIKHMSRCEIMDHSWKYNFMSMPSKRICADCKKKETFDPHTLDWTDVEFTDSRTDEQLIKEWFY